MAYCEHKKRHRYSKEREDNQWKSKAQSYIDPKNWEYSFKQEATVSDPEQSFLCRYVFAKLMGTNTDNIPANKIYIENKGTTYHFDVMNNLNGKTFEKNYKYTIGNFAPIPAVKFNYILDDETTIKAHLQLIHKWKGEKWDDLLRHMKANWDNCVGTSSFAHYMMDTCQQLYYEDIFTSFYDEKPDLNKVNWSDRVCEWNKYINDNEELEIISLDDSKDSYDKIKFLIAARGRCILSILNNKNTPLT